MRCAYTVLLTCPLLILGPLPGLAQTNSPPQGLTPEQAVQRMKPAPGFTVQLVACEPMIRQPVSMSFDDKGRLWVLQYLQFPYPVGLKPVQIDKYLRIKWDRVLDPPPKGPKGADRITILSDPDENGRFRQAKDFVTGLNVASGFCLGRGGVWVVQPPYLLFYPDRDGDDVPDGDPEVHLKGFGLDDTHSLANSLQWGPDGWLYGATGSTSYTNIRGIEFVQGIWRYHPLTKEFELFSEGGGNTYGLDFDRQGNAIASTNWGGYAMLHQVQGAYYIKSFAKHGELKNPHAYGYFHHVPYTGFKGGHVTCGGIVYHGGAFPKEFEGKFIAGNLLSNDIYWHPLDKDGSTYKSRHGGELLISNDPWFRPVDCLLGPDGAVYIADFYDRRAAHLDPRDTWDRTNGRIYRISYRQPSEIRNSKFEICSSKLLKRPLRTYSNPELIALLAHPNDWYRREARRILFERRDPVANEELRKIACSPTHPANLEAYWTLYAAGGFTDSLAERMLRHPREEIRTWTVRFLGDSHRLTPEQRDLLQRGARTEKSPLVRSQMACSARRLPGKDALPLVGELLKRDEDLKDQHIPLLLWWAIETHAISSRNEVLKLFESPGMWQLPLVRQVITERVARRYTAEGKDEDFATVATLLERAPTPTDEKLLLAGMDKALEKMKVTSVPQPLEPVLERLRKKYPEDLGILKLALKLGDSAALARAHTLLTDLKQPDANRATILETVGQLHQPQWIPRFLQALTGTKSNAVRAAALGALQSYDDPRIAPAVLQVYPQLPADLKGRARALLASRPASALQLLRAADSGIVSAKDIPLDQARQMAGFKQAELDKLLEKHFGRLTPATPGEKQNKIGYFRYALGKGKGDASRGAVLFEKNCATCHTLFGKGEKIGPDLTTADRKDREFLLLHIVDPGAAQRPEYANQVVTTTDGRTLTGVVVEASPEAIVLADVKAQKTRLPRSQIEEMTPSPVSLMPEGLLDPLDDQQLCDLFAYLQSDPPAPGTKAYPRLQAEESPNKKKGSLPPLQVCLVSGSEEYKSDESLAKLQKYLEANYNITCTCAFATKVDNLPGLENLEKCDVMLLYTRRLQIDGEQLERVKKYCLSGKPIVGLRTASHAFQKWLALDKEVLGGNYKNHFGAGPLCEVRIEEKAKNHPVLKGVKPFSSVSSLYKNTGIAADCTLLMTGSIPGHTEPLTWIREYKGGRIFYSSLGHPRDFENENFVRMVVNALYWTTRREVPD